MVPMTKASSPRPWRRGRTSDTRSLGMARTRPMPLLKVRSISLWGIWPFSWRKRKRGGRGQDGAGEGKSMVGEEDLAHQGIAVGMETAGGQADKAVAHGDIRAVDEL